jgi:hypothetical protein
MRKTISILALMMGVVIAQPAFAGYEAYVSVKGKKQSEEQPKAQMAVGQKKGHIDGPALKGQKQGAIDGPSIKAEFKDGKLLDESGKSLPDGQYQGPSGNVITVKNGVATAEVESDPKAKQAEIKVKPTHSIISPRDTASGAAVGRRQQ